MKKLNLFAVTLNIVLVLVQIFVTSGRSVDGAAIASINRDLLAISEENTLLRDSINRTMSIQNIAASAKSANLVPLKIEKIDPPSVALKP